MKKENIKERANELYEDNSFAYKGFIKGAEWRINSVWHPVDETPRDNSLILCKTKDDDYFLYGKNQRYYKEMSEDVEMWAYIEDLIPTNE